MSRHNDRGELALAAFSLDYELKEKDLGPYAVLRKRGMEFNTRAWRVGDIGSLCVIHMKALLGLMGMETVVFSPTSIDAPLFNFDWMSVFGTEVQMAELYDVQIQPWPNVCEAQFQDICDAAADLPDMEREAKWYDDILYPCSCAKKGRGIADRLYGLAEDYVACYVAQLSELAPCDPVKKRELVRDYAEHLYADGGVAVKQMVDLFGSETAQHVIVECMYGVEGE